MSGHAFLDAISQHQARGILVGPGAPIMTEAEQALLMDIEGSGQPQKGQ